jgi:hypothetical protein
MLVQNPMLPPGDGWFNESQSRGCAYCADPVASTKHVASVTSAMTSAGATSVPALAEGGVNNALANTLLTAQLMFWGIESVV